MEIFLVALLNGLVYGLLLFMVSSGLTLIFGMMGVLNFAHASFYMLGAYLGFATARYVGFFPGLVLATAGVAFVGYACEQHLLRKVRSHGHVQELLLTFGLFFAIDELVKLFFGPYPVAYSIPESLRFAAFTIGGTEYPFFRVLIGMTAITMFALIFVLLTFTRIGMIVRAAVQYPAMVSALGYNVKQVFSALFAIGAALAGLAGAIGGAFYSTSPNMAGELGAIVFVVVVVGGLGSLGGALAASLIIGVLVSAAVYIDASLGDLALSLGLISGKAIDGLLAIPLSATAGIIPYVLMLAVLLVRPSGIAGEERS